MPLVGLQKRWKTYVTDSGNIYNIIFNLRDALEEGKIQNVVSIDYFAQKPLQRSGAAAMSHQVDLGEGSREIASAIQTAQGSISKLRRQLGQNMATR